MIFRAVCGQFPLKLPIEVYCFQHQRELPIAERAPNSSPLLGALHFLSTTESSPAAQQVWEAPHPLWQWEVHSELPTDDPQWNHLHCSSNIRKGQKVILVKSSPKSKKYPKNLLSWGRDGESGSEDSWLMIADTFVPDRHFYFFSPPEVKYPRWIQKPQSKLWSDQRGCTRQNWSYLNGDFIHFGEQNSLQ